MSAEPLTREQIEAMVERRRDAPISVRDDIARLIATVQAVEADRDALAAEVRGCVRERDRALDDLLAARLSRAKTAHERDALARRVEALEAELRWFCKTANFGDGAIVDRFRRALAADDEAEGVMT